MCERERAIHLSIYPSIYLNAYVGEVSEIPEGGGSRGSSAELEEPKPEGGWR